MTIKKVFLHTGKEQSVLRRHPWIFSGAIQRVEGAPENGDWVEVIAKNKTIGFGHFQHASIAVRLLHFGHELPENFWSEKIKQAYTLRQLGIIPPHTNAYRLVHGEGDGLPGLVVDVYDETAVVQTHTDGMRREIKNISDAIQAILSVQSVFHKPATDENKKEYSIGKSQCPTVVQEYGLSFEVNWEEGQKTGFFIDQRENRKRIASYCQGKKVLNTFCYTGGFSVYALQAGASLVHSVDASEKAIEAAKRNLQLNQFDDTKHTCSAGDVFDFLEKSANEYDVIILDPPAFAKHLRNKNQAIKGYQRLNALALKKIKAGGILATFSCSQVIHRKLFYDTLVSAAIQSGRIIQVLEHLSQPADHPVSIYHPEGEYLKGLILHVG